MFGWRREYRKKKEKWLEDTIKTSHESARRSAEYHKRLQNLIDRINVLIVNPAPDAAIHREAKFLGIIRDLVALIAELTKPRWIFPEEDINER